MVAIPEKVTECAFDGYLSEIADCEKRLLEEVTVIQLKNGKGLQKEGKCMVPEELLKEALLLGSFLIEAHEKFKMHLWAKQAFYMAKVADVEYRLGFYEDSRTHATSADNILAIAKGKPPSNNNYV